MRHTKYFGKEVLKSVKTALVLQFFEYT